MLPLTLTFAARPGENARAHLLLQRRGWMLYFAVLAAIVIAIGVALLLALQGPLLVDRGLLNRLGPLAFLVLALLVFRPFTGWLGIRFSRRNSPEATITLSNAGIAVQTDTAQTQLEWRAVQRLLIDRDVAVLQLRPGAGLFLVRRALADPDLWQPLCEELAQRLAANTPAEQVV